MGTSYSPNIVKDGLIFQIDPANPRSYPRSGTNIIDLAGTSNGTLSGASGGNNTPQWENVNAGIFDFDGTDDNISFGDALGNLIGDNYTGGLSFSFWLNPDITSSEDGVFNFESNRISFVIRSNSLRLYSQNCSAGQCFSYSYTNPNNEWAHCAICFLPGGSSFYLNGESVRTWTYTDLNINTKDFSIGWYAATNYAYNGKLSNFKIYNRELSASEVKQNYNALKARFQ